MSAAEAVARQLEGALAKVSSPVDVIVLVDGSSSVSSTQFEIMRLCIRQLVDMFPSHQEGGVRLGIIQFTTTIKIECNLMSNKQTTNCSITAMSQMGGSTNAGGAFGNARFIFDTNSRAASRCVIFLTDGDCSDAVQIASLMRDTESTHIVAIGTGLSDAKDLAKIASNNSYFLFNSYDNLRHVFTYLNRTAASPPKVEIIARGSHSATLQILLPPEVLKFKEWEVESFNFTNNTWKKIGASQADIQCLHNLEANIKYKIRARVLLPNDTWSNYSTDLEFRTLIEAPLAPILRDPQQRVEECKKWVASISRMRPNSRLRKAGVNRLNLLFLGRMGAGKSSLVDSMASAVTGQYTVLAPFRVSLETVTQTYKMYPLTRSKSREPQICIYDVYGWSETNYKNLELGCMLNGQMKAGYTETVSGFMQEKNNPHYRTNPTYNDKIHGVIVVVSAATVGSTAEMKKLNEFYGHLTSRGYQPIFVLTKVDRLPDEVLIGHNERVFDSGIVDATLDIFSDLSSIPRASVLPVINYQGPYVQGPDYVIEMLALNALKAAVRTAETFLETHEEEIVEDAKGKEGKSSKSKKGKDKKKPKAKDSSDEEDSKSDDSEGEKISEDESDKKSKSSKKEQGKAETSPKRTTKVSSDSLSPPLSLPLSPPLSPSASSIMGLIEAAAYLSVDDSDLLELLETKEIPGKKIGSNWRITREAIDRYLNA